MIFVINLHPYIFCNGIQCKECVALGLTLTCIFLFLLERCIMSSLHFCRSLAVDLASSQLTAIICRSHLVVYSAMFFAVRMCD